MRAEQLRKMSLKELMARLGEAQPGSIAHPPLAAEYERRKFVLQVWALVIAGLGLLFGAAYFFLPRLFS
jgi:hypothetical protein